jgi:hypothetical protein
MQIRYDRTESFLLLTDNAGTSPGEQLPAFFMCRISLLSMKQSTLSQACPGCRAGFGTVPDHAADYDPSPGGRMASFEPPKMVDYPPELLQAVVHEASTDAWRLAMFLQQLGLLPSSGANQRTSLCLPRSLLLGLGAALRLFSWECSGARIHLPETLPSAQLAIYNLISIAVKQPGQLESLALGLVRDVLRANLELMAWHGQEVLGSHIILGDADEDPLVDPLADFLWANRHALRSQESSKS